jgi:hypothetical protein
MDLLFDVIIAGMAVGYIAELTSKLLEGMVPTWVTKLSATVPTAIFMNYLLGVNSWELIPAGFASGFFALVVMAIINRGGVNKR